MPDQFTERLQLFSSSDNINRLNRLQRGIEKESLRVGLDGKLAQTPHPKSLGSALTHPHITTDFSEALLEFITPVSTDIEESLQTLDNIHRAVCIPVNIFHSRRNVAKASRFAAESNC